jgi:cell division septation protein DedD
MPGGKGGWDLYMSKRKGDTWAKPENLGPAVNTPGNEISPSLSEDRLYFSSDWHIGLGGFDIFSVPVIAEGFGEVMPVGYPVNSPKDDIDFIWDTETQSGYFSSNRTGGAGSYDIYVAKPQFREVEVQVKDSQSMLPVAGAAVTLSPGISMASNTDATGVALLRQPMTGAYEVIVRKEGYELAHVPLTRREKGSKLVYNVYLQSDKPVADIKEPDNPEEPPVAVVPPTPRPGPEPVEQTKTNTIPRTPPVERYFIQIAALARNADFTPYSELRMYGDLIVHDDDNYSRLRVGTFESEDQARATLARIKSGGYRDAFIVKHAVAREEQESSGIFAREYKVRLGTYAKAGNFDPSRVDHLGTIQSYRKDDLTIMLLAGFPNLAAAKRARDAAVIQGFGDAYVVLDNGGTLEKVH